MDTEKSKQTNTEENKQRTNSSMSIETNAESKPQDNQGYGEQIIQRLPIPNTDFEIVGNEDYGYFVGWGKFRLTETKKSEIEAIDTLNIEQWRITVKIAAIVHENLMTDTLRLLQETAVKPKNVDN